MPKTEYKLSVAVDSEILVRYTVERGRVVEFMVELVVRGKPVIRYDGAHGFARIDRYNLAGRQRKERLNVDFNTALTVGELDIKQHWATYRERFLKGEYP
ncbi:MAG: hypothetical protein N3E42_07475 [Candidatus Bipolaricaulota bacterium]|nr:hypothetical protein [Candidatus Bipolaricaulota bacterium]